MVRGAVAQLAVEFVAAASNGFGIKAGDFRQQFQAAMSATTRLAGRDPAALLFVQSAEQHIELTMIPSFLMITRPTRRTTTLVNHTFRDHNAPPFLGVPEDYQSRPK